MSNYSVLVDHSAYRDSITEEWWVDETYIAPQCFSNRGLLVRRPKTIRDDQVWRRSQIECLRSIAWHAANGHLSLHTYSELEMEAMPGWIPTPTEKGSLFRTIPFHTIPAAVERSRLFTLIGDEMVNRDAFRRYCEWLMGIHVDKLSQEKIAWLRTKCTDFELSNLINVERFRSLCRHVSRKHYPDAFHLWTAEVNQIKFFLTNDKKFINAVTKSSKLELYTKPVCPEVLLNELQQRAPVPP